MDRIRVTKPNDVRYLKKGLIFVFFILFCHPLLVAQWADSISLNRIDYSIQTDFLSNDLKILYLYNPNSPLASIEWALFPGTIVQRPNQEGMLALLSKFLLRPTRKDLSPMQFQDRVANLGLSTDSKILTESIHFQWILPNKFLKEGLALLRDCWLAPKWIDLEFQREKILIARQIEQAERSPSWFLYREMMQKILGEQDISRQTIAANYVSIQKIELSQLEAFKSQYFKPQNTILAISGSYSFQQIMNWADSLFADWVNPEPLEDTFRIALNHSASAFFITSEKTQIPIAAVAFPFHDTLTLKNYLIGRLIAEIFNSQYTKFGKFFSSNDIGYQIICDYKPSRLFSEFLFTIPIKKEKMDYAIDLIRHFYVYAFYGQWINAKDLELAKNKLETTFFQENQASWQILHQLTQHYFKFNGLDYLNFLDTLRAIQLYDLQNFFQKSVNITNPVAGFLMNSEDTKEFEIEKKLTDFWIQPFGPIYDIIDPEHVLIPPMEVVSSDTLKVPADSAATSSTDTLLTSSSEPSNLPLDSLMQEKAQIYFEFNSYNLNRSSIAILEKFAQKIEVYPSLRIKLTGHTDSSGPEEFNLKLSLQRANQVKNYLVKRYRVPAEKIETEGLGESQLAYPENTPQNRAKNRRVEIQWIIPQ